MKSLIFDTETTGLIPKYTRINSKTDLTKLPYIVQISWILFDNKTQTILNEQDHIIKMNEGISIPIEASNIHGITNEISQTKGKPINDVLKLFLDDMKKTHYAVAHNIKFDEKMINIECLRNNICNKITNNVINYCTVLNSVELCKIKTICKKTGKEYNKYPKLEELNNFLFNEKDTLKNLHNSLADILICLRCYYKLITNVDLYNLSSHFTTRFNEICHK